MDRRAVTGHPNDVLSPEHPVGRFKGCSATMNLLDRIAVDPAIPIW